MLEASLRSIFPDGVLVGARTIHVQHHIAFREEIDCIRDASPERGAEFLTGRELARTLFRQFDLVDCPILPGARRAPIWPVNATASIAHAGDTCVAVAALRSRFCTLGVDIEPAATIEESLWPTICTPTEIKHIRTASGDQGTLVTLLFSAKESLYKAIFPLTGFELDFQHVSITPRNGESLLDVEFHNLPANITRAIPTTLRVAHAIGAHYIFTGAWAAAEPPPPPK